jgi:hypothetical protein
MPSRRRGLLATLWTIACAPPRSEPVEPTAPGDTPAHRAETPSRTAKKTSPSARVRGRPHLERASLTSAQEVRLYFSEPVTPTTGFDPRQFRLSMGGHYRDIGYAATYYYEIGTDHDSLDAATFTEIEVVDESTLLLQLAAPIAADACDSDPVDPSAHEITGIFLHYDDRKTGGIVDRDGHHLRDIAEAWVLREADQATYYGVRARPLAALGPIRCEFPAVTRAPVEPSMPKP